MADDYDLDSYLDAVERGVYYKPPPAPVAAIPTTKRNTGIGGDVWTGLKSGVEQIPGIVTGLADIPTALAFNARPFTRGAEAIGRFTGFEPGKWAEDAQKEYSPQMQQSTQEVGQAWDDPNASILEKTGAVMAHPRYVTKLVAENLPQMVAGGIGGRALMTAGRVAIPATEGVAAKYAPGYLERTIGERWASPVAAGASEGFTQTGQSMEQGKDISDQRKMSVAALGSGAVDAFIAMGAGRVAQKMGLETLETKMAKGFDAQVRNELSAIERAGGSLGKRVGMEGAGRTIARTGAGAISEGILQELPQSAQEQVWQNWAENKHLWQGVDRQAVEGMLVGAAMGAGANVRGARQKDLTKPAVEQETPPVQEGAPPAPPGGAAPRSMIDEAIYTDLRKKGADHETALFASRNDEYGIKMREVLDLDVGQPATTIPPQEVRPTAPPAPTQKISAKQRLEDLWAQNAPEDAPDFPAVSELNDDLAKTARRAAIMLEKSPTEGVAGQKALAEFTKTRDTIYAAHKQETALKPAQEAFLAEGGSKGRWAQLKKIPVEELPTKLLDLAADIGSKASTPNSAYLAAYAAHQGITIEEAQNAVQERSAAQEVPRAGTAGQTITEGGEGVGQVEQGQEVAPEGKAQEVALTTNALDTFSASLPKQQKAVFDLVRQAAENNELDKFISADGTWQATEIGKALGISKQAVNATKALRAKLDSAAGMNVKAALAARTAAVRSTEMSDVERLGLSPAMQVQGLEPTDVYGTEGAEPSMGTIETVGGSQGATSADVSGPLTARNYAIEREVRKIIREGGESTAVETTGTSEVAATANREQKIRDIKEADRSGDLVDAVYEWNQQVGRLPGVTEIPTDFASMELNADGIDLLHAVVSAYQDVQLQIEAALEAGTRFTDPTGAYEYEFNRIVRERTAREVGAKRVVDGKPDGAQPALEAKPETGEGAGEAGVNAKKPVKVETRKPRRVVAKPEAKAGLTAVEDDRYFQLDEEASRNNKEQAEYDELKSRRESSPWAFPKLSETAGAENPISAETLTSRLKAMFRAAPLFDKIVTIYTTQADAVTKGALSEKAKYVAGFKTVDGKIGLIAENIEGGQELGVFLHEVGVHLGMEKLIGKANMAWLDTRVRAWAKKNDGSPESVAAKAAIARSEGSTTDDNTEGRIAYMVEELVKQGVQPRAAAKGTLAEWLSKFVNWTRVALIKMGLDAKTSFSGQNLVDLAYGAASMELTGKQGATRTYQNREAFESAEKYVKDDYETLATATLPNGQVSATRIPRGVKLSEAAPRKAAELIAGAAGSSAVTDAAHYLKVAMTSLEMLHDTVTRVAKTLPSVTDWYKGIMDMKATRTEIKRRADVIAGMASGLSRESYAKTNKFIERATTEQKWYRQPEWLTRKVVVDAGMAAEWKKLTSEEQAIADAVFKFGEDESNNMQKQFKALGVSDVFTQIGKLEGPYAPLMRFGGFVGILKSQTLLDAEKAAKTGSAASIARVDALKRDSNHFVSKKFYTLGQATAFTTANKSRFVFSDAFTESERLDDKSSMGYQQLQKIMAAVDANTSAMPAGAKEALHKLVKDIYMTTVDQTSARQSGQKRQGIAGADENMLSAFAVHARAHAAFVASIEHGPEVNKAFYAMQQEAKDTTTGKRTGQDDFNLLARHYAEMTHYNPSPIQDAVMAGTTVWMLSTSLSYHIQNFSQAVVKSIPKLAADFGAGKYTEAWKHMVDGYKMMGSITEYGRNPDLSKIKDGGLRAALTYAADHGMLDVGIEEDLSHLGRFQTGYAMIDGSSTVVSKVLHKLRQVARTVESWNRISSGTAAYNMAIANGRTHDQAQSYVMDMLNSTQGDTSRTDAPLLLKKIPKVMAQYKRFQFMSAAMYTKATYAAFKGATAEERGIGRRMLGFMLLHTSVAGGVLALPLMNLASLAFGMLGGDDDPEDMDTVIRRHLGEGVVSDFLLDGAPKALLGIDMSAKLSDRNLFSIAPYTTFDFSSKAGVIGTVAGVAGGPSLSQAGRMADGVGLMKRGEMYKGVEKMVPKGFESAMQSFRMANDGVTLKNGDVIVKPEDLSAYALALSAFGMPSEQMREITRNQNVQYTVRKFYTDRTKELTQQYVAAAREGDSEEMAKIRVDWRLMQLSKDKVRYLFNDVPQELKKQPTANLATSVQSAKKRQRLEQRVAAQ